METAVILAGGLGTRLRPLTEKIPKALIDIDERNLTEHNLLLLKKAGVKTAYLAVGYLHEKIQDFFGDEYEGIKIKYIIEKEPLGTGGWMHLVDKEDFTDNFIAMNGDDLLELDFNEVLKIHKENSALATLALHEVDDVTKFGVAEMEGKKIKKFVEKPKQEDAPSNWVNQGRYVFSPRIFDLVPKEKKFMLEKELFPKVAEQGKLYFYRNTGLWFPTNDFEQWEHVKKNWRLPE